MKVHYSEAERVTVEDRGAGFGKIYVHREDDSVEAVLLWTGSGVMTEGVIEPTRDQINRAVRALAETKAGAEMLGVEPRQPAEPAAPKTKFKCEELDPQDLGVELDGFNEPKALGQWSEVDVNRCAAGIDCVGFSHGMAAAVGYHLRSHGDYERCEWVTPWRVNVDDQDGTILCEDCADHLTKMLEKLGLEELK